MPANSALLAVFMSGWMLGWMFAASIPLIIHLFSRRYRVEMPWAATQFLRVAQVKVSGRFQLWQWILLALRCLALMLLALAWPILDSKQRNSKSRLSNPAHDPAGRFLIDANDK